MTVIIKKENQTAAPEEIMPAFWNKLVNSFLISPKFMPKLFFLKKTTTKYPFFTWGNNSETAARALLFNLLRRTALLETFEETIKLKDFVLPGIKRYFKKTLLFFAAFPLLTISLTSSFLRRFLGGMNRKILYGQLFPPFPSPFLNYRDLFRRSLPF
ncbi:MAG: hypothetical protein A3A10_01285 [Candidatus Tagabacteria bacterium RIFCSPLOWO2_01_FULL_42_9]|uniref:Uncharacterized protein n=1 Tax=Candidatus Tagabacteria bacterium RIFCSPLOWO2_01_FULL_42_9 TaxID=1802296 RepID=A0A1G2LTW9_9BACT|nr:MAG: hypothetical protein A3A10_01285 [Candidatus Tagabacteria bacterium RIFCSPLOWO2_01_FULL_42_9]